MAENSYACPINITEHNKELSFMAKITITGGAKNGEIIDLKNADLVLGRHSDCDLILDDTRASSHHARIYRDKTEWMLTDLKSTNGTLAHRQPVSMVTLR